MLLAVALACAFIFYWNFPMNELKGNSYNSDANMTKLVPYPFRGPNSQRDTKGPCDDALH